MRNLHPRKSCMSYEYYSIIQDLPELGLTYRLNVRAGSTNDLLPLDIVK